VKVAYLLVTTAWLVGAQTPGAPGDKDAKQPAPAAVTVAPVTACTSCNSCSSCNSCDSGCGGFLQRCRDFCSQLFSGHGCASCGGTCGSSCQPACAPAPCPTSCCTSTPSCSSGCGGLFGGCSSGCGGLFGGCSSGCGGLFGGWGHSCFSGCGSTCSTGCGCASSCGGLWSGHGGCCGSDGCGGGFLQGCRDFLQRLCHHDDCCTTGCSTGCTSCGTVVAPKGAETIPPPAGGKEKPAQPMPGGKAGGGEPPQAQFQIINPLSPGAVQTPNLEAPPAPPALGPAGLTPGRPF